MGKVIKINLENHLGTELLLRKICALKGITPEQFILDALKDEIDRQIKKIGAPS